MLIKIKGIDGIQAKIENNPEHLWCYYDVFLTCNDRVLAVSSGKRVKLTKEDDDICIEVDGVTSTRVFWVPIRKNARKLPITLEL